jgi:TatD DNase family protein
MLSVSISQEWALVQWRGLYEMSIAAPHGGYYTRKRGWMHMYFDTHAHYDDEAFDADRDELLASLPARGVSLVVNPATNARSAEMALSLAERHPHVFAAVGWHPHEADSFDKESSSRIRAWVQREKTVAIGEIGLDYHYDFSPRETQRRVFEEQLDLAEELNLPVIVHDREAHGDIMDIVRRHSRVRGVFHCWSGSPEMAAELFRLGWYLSFTGSITFKNARRGLETLAAAPADRIMLETDAPYLAPTPRRGQRNDCTLLPFIAAVAAGARCMGTEELAALTMENGRRFFGLDESGSRRGR